MELGILSILGRVGSAVSTIVRQENLGNRGLVQKTLFAVVPLPAPVAQSQIAALLVRRL